MALLFKNNDVFDYQPQIQNGRLKRVYRKPLRAALIDPDSRLVCRNHIQTPQQLTNSKTKPLLTTYGQNQIENNKDRPLLQAGPNPF